MKSVNKSVQKYSSILAKPLLAALLLLGFWSCEHETDPPDGPNLVDRFGPFEVVAPLTVNTSNVDFSAGENVVFSAQFNKNIDWVITITGSESGAVRIIEGFDRFINAENATWNGNTTELPFFKNELCNVELTVPEEPDYIDSAEVEIIGTRVYPGTVFWDFEEDAGSDIFVGNFEFELTPNTARQSENPVPAQGDFFWLMEGTDDVVPNFFCGLVRLDATINGTTYIELPTLIPENLYFNFFLYNDGRPYGIAVIQFAFDSNDSGAYEDGVDALYQLEGDFPLDFEGWRQFSHTMADVNMTPTELEKIVAIRVLLISDLNSQPNPQEQVQFGIDYMTFTQGSPLAL